MPSPLHIAARQWVEAGFWVFPCVPKRKEPATKNGVNDASNDIAQIDAWWTENDQYNVGVSPGRCGSTVVDTDPPLGTASLDAISAIEGPLPRTLTIKTPRGGLHYWFNGETRSSTGTIAPNIDTRGVGGYVLVPPSVIGPGEYKKNPEGGAYTYQCADDIADLPAWVAKRLVVKTTHETVSGADWDLPHNFERAVREIKSWGPIREGGKADQTTLQAFLEFRDQKISPEMAMTWMEEHYDIQPKDERFQEFLERKCYNAYERKAAGRNEEPGAKAVAPASEAFAHFIAGGPEIAESSDGRPTDGGDRSKPSRFRPLRLREAREAKEPSWLIPSLVQANSLCVIYGKLKSFKTFLALDICLGIATETETFGYKPKRGAVVYTVGEGQWNIAHSHAPSWMLARQVPDAEDFWIVPCVPKAIFDGDAAELVAQIKARGIRPKAVVIDTAARALGGLDENNARDVGLFVTACDHIREHLDCTVIVVHHAGKDAAKGSRGSSALDAAADTVLEVIRHEKTLFCLLRVKEQRNAPEREEPYYFEGRMFGPSLAFFPVDAAAYIAATAGDSATSKKNVAAALVRLGARGQDNAIETAVLASNLATHHNTDAGIIEKVLKKGDRTPHLKAYCYQHEKRGLLWFIVDATG